MNMCSRSCSRLTRMMCSRRRWSRARNDFICSGRICSWGAIGRISLKWRKHAGRSIGSIVRLTWAEST